jgi:hypothetical protein
VRPLLLGERKFGFRFSLPLAAFVYREGVARFCTQPYVAPVQSPHKHRGQ